LLHRLAERGGSGFGLVYQAIGLVGQLVPVRDELACGIAHLSGFQTHFRREHCASVEMTTNAFGQVRTATRTQMYAVAEKVSAKLVLSEAPGARDALCHHVVPAIPEEDCTLLGAQITRPAAVDVSHHPSANLNSVFERDDLQASRALRLRHFCTLMDHRPLVYDTFAQLM